MKRITALMLCLAMVISFAGCAAKAEKITKDENGEIVAESSEKKEKSYDEMDLEEKLAYKAENPDDEAGVRFDNGLVAPAQDAETKLWGYINSLGEWVIEPAHSAAYPFSMGFAPVLDDYSEYVIIDEKGERFIEMVDRKSLKAASYFSEGVVAAVLDTGMEQNKMYMFSNGLSIIMAYKLPSTKGINYESLAMFAVATPFKGGHAVTMRRTNASVIEAVTGGRANMTAKGYYQSPCIIDYRGEIECILPAGYDVDDYCLDDNGIIIVRDMTTDDELYGLCDVEGNIIAECKYRRIEHCEGNYYLACNTDGFWGYLYRTGKEVIDFKYHDAMPFSDGLAAVCEDGLWGLINTEGEYMVHPQYDEVFPLKTANLGTNVGAGAFAGGFAAVRKGSYWALINPEGDILRAAKCSDCPYLGVSGELLVFRNEEGLCGLCDSECNTVLEPKYLGIGLFGE